MVYRPINALLAFAISCFAFLYDAPVALAELPPGAYEQLLKEAQEVYKLRVDNVEQQPGETSTTIHYLCDAEILAVERSKAGRKPGDKIRFATYYVPPEVWRRGFAGPKSPPLLKAGWQGTVYLNPPEEGDVLQIAAYGRSFIPAAVAGAALNPSPNAGPSLGIMSRPSPEGGLVVLSVRLDSLADDLGLRPGDRVVKVNGQMVNNPDDVRAALGTTTDGVSVSVLRRQKSLELGLKR
ncbi:MAG: PDZ domain-containing protein [Singulisphaera sp.]